MNNQSTSKSSDHKHSQSYRRHRKQQVWQILLPIIAGFLIIITIAILVVLAAMETEAGGPVSQWADISLIWLIIPVLVFALFFALVLAGLIFLVARLLKILPGYTFQAQYYVGFASDQVTNWMNKLAAPFIGVRSVNASLKALWVGIFRRTGI